MKTTWKCFSKTWIIEGKSARKELIIFEKNIDAKKCRYMQLEISYTILPNCGLKVNCNINIWATTGPLSLLLWLYFILASSRNFQN